MKQELTSIISRIIPQLYRIRIDIVEPLLNEIKEKFIREYKKKAYADDISLGTFEKEFNDAVDDKAKERVIKNLVKYSTDHLMGVIVFTIRKMFVEEDDKKITLTIPEDKERDFFSSLIEQTYRKYINSRIKEQYFSSFVRTKEFFEIGQDSYSALRSLYKFDETEFIDSNRSPIT